MCGGHFFHEAEHFIAPVADAATAIFAPELLPIEAPLAGAVQGAVNGGGIRGALEGGAEGAILGQIGGTGDLALGATDATGPVDAFGVATGGTSLGGQALNAIGGAASGAFDDVSNALGFTGASPDAAIGTNSVGASINNAGDTISAPAASISGGSGTPLSSSQVTDIDATQVGSQLGGDVSGPSTSSSPGLGSVGGTTASSSVAPSTLPSLGDGASQAIGGTSNLEAAAGTPTASDTLGSLTPNSSLQQQFTAANTDVLNAGGASSFSGGGNGTGAIGGVASSGTTPASGGILNTIENTATKAALPLGGLAYDAIKGPAKLPSEAQALGPGGQATAPLLALENQGATEATTGQLTPTQQANVLQYVQSQQNQLLQQLASQGVQNPTQDSRYIAGMQQIQNNALQLQQQYITAAINEATSAGGAASGNISTVANEQIQNDTAFQNSLAEAFGALGGAIGGGGVTLRPGA